MLTESQRFKMDRQGRGAPLNLGRSGAVAATGPGQLEVWDATWGLWVLSGKEW